MTDVPVLLLIFNRPDYTARVFETIRKAQPTRLYIAADGPRAGNSEDIRLCAETKAVVEKIDWPCAVKRLYRTENKSCDFAIIEAVNWFFTMEESGIILEDDCIPAASFFEYCRILLEKYKNDTQIALISGTVFYNKTISAKHAFLKSDLMFTWGFATWRRVWQEIDFNKKPDLPAAKALLMQRYNQNEWFVQYHMDILTKAVKEPIVYWDYSFLMHNLATNKTGIIPTVNLVSNIGNSGTHFTNSKSLLLHSVVHEINITSDFDRKEGILSPAQKKKLIKNIVQKIYPVGWRNRLYLWKEKLWNLVK